jgi:lysozyme
MGTAEVPTKNDRCTVGFGSTFKEDGSPVQCGETITPVQAVKRSLSHIAKDETQLKSCVTAPLSQKEYDILVNFSYQYGTAATCKSSMVKNINAGNYAQACEGYTLYKMSGGFDCSIPGNKVCSGVWTRNLNRKADCMAAQFDTEDIPTQPIPVVQPEPHKSWWSRVKGWFA